MTNGLVVDINVDKMPGKKLSQPFIAELSSVARRAWTSAKHKISKAEISLLITDDMQIRKLNKRYRDIDRATNVLSFVCDSDAMLSVDGAPVLVGDIVLGCGVIEREATLHGKSFSDHMCHLVVHGVLHLAGYDHESSAEADEMKALEISILAESGIGDPYINWIDGQL
tara:strand:+ start:315 stop:821 length:507 start_codon:yes stop_codon:yes gene_type:complete